MNINLHAGHNPDGRTACGATGLLRESTEARRVKDEVIRQLRQLGHTVYDCTCENGKNQTDVLKKIVAACNAHTVDLDVSIHFNAGAKDASGNGTTTGTEAWVYSAASPAKKYAEAICKAISADGYRNRGVKVNPGLYVLRHTKAPAVLVECCFVDDRDDAERYDCQKMAAAIVYGITGQRAKTPETPGDTTAPATPQTPDSSGTPLYRVQVIRQYGAFLNKANADRLQAELKAAGFDAVIVKA